MRTFNPTLLNPAVQALFLEGAKDAQSDAYGPKIATLRKSKRRSETYGLRGAPPALEEHKGSTTFTSMSDDDQTLSNLLYTCGVAISRQDWDDDQVGGFRDAIVEMGAEGVLHPNAKLMQLLIDGDATVIWDGDNFFDTTHPYGNSGGVNSNIISGGGVGVSTFATDLNKVITRFSQFRGDSARPHNPRVRKITLCCPVSMRESVLTAIRATEISSTSNAALSPAQGIKFETIFDADLEADDADDWYALETSHTVKGLILQEREKFSIEMEAKNSGVAFSDEVLRWKARWRGAFGYGDYKRAIKVTN